MSSLAFVVAAACGSNHHAQPDTPVDTPPDAKPDSPPLNLVTVTNSFQETPVFLAYRDGTGPWQALDATNPSTWSLHVTDAYTLVSVCGDTTQGFDVAYAGATFSADGPSIDLPCFSFGTGTPVTPVSVKGTMVQAGMVQMGFVNGSSTTPNWQFDLSVDPGMHELVASSATRVLIRRNLNITADTTVPNVDVVAAGSAFVSVPLTITGAQPDETLRSRVTWFTGNDFAFFTDATPALALVVPDALIAPTDSHRLRVSAQTLTTDRFISERYKSGAPTTFDLPARLTNVTVAADHATWTGTLPDGTSEFYTESSVNNVFADAHISGTASWLGTQTSYAIDYNIPGFQPEWKVDFATADFADVDITNTVGAQFTFTEALFTPPALAARPHRPSLVDRREMRAARLR